MRSTAALALSFMTLVQCTLMTGDSRVRVPIQYDTPFQHLYPDEVTRLLIRSLLIITLDLMTDVRDGEALMGRFHVANPTSMAVHLDGSISISLVLLAIGLQ